MTVVSCVGCGRQFQQPGMLMRAVTENPTGRLCPDCVRQRGLVEQAAAQTAASVAAAQAATYAANSLAEAHQAQQLAQQRAALAADTLFQLEQAVVELSRMVVHDPFSAAVIARIRERWLQSSGLTPQSFADLESKRTLARLTEGLRKLGDVTTSDAEAAAKVDAYFDACGTLRNYNLELGVDPEPRLPLLRARIDNARRDYASSVAATVRNQTASVVAAALALVFVTGAWAAPMVATGLVAVTATLVALFLMTTAHEQRAALVEKRAQVIELEAQEASDLPRLRERFGFLVSAQGGALIRRVHEAYPAVARAARDHDLLGGGWL